MYYTNLKQKNLVLRNTLVLGYTIAGTLLCWVVGASLIRVASGASVFLFLCSLICLCVVIYILICRFLEKRRCRKRVQEKETGEFNVHFRKDYMLYDQQTFSLKRFKKVYLYHDLYYFVDSDVYSTHSEPHRPALRATYSIIVAAGTGTLNLSESNQ